jgi:hypothetical protein
MGLPGEVMRTIEPHKIASAHARVAECLAHAVRAASLIKCRGTTTFAEVTDGPNRAATLVQETGVAIFAPLIQAAREISAPMVVFLPSQPSAAKRRFFVDWHNLRKSGSNLVQGRGGSTGGRAGVPSPAGFIGGVTSTIFRYRLR